MGEQDAGDALQGGPVVRGERRQQLGVQPGRAAGDLVQLRGLGAVQVAGPRDRPEWGPGLRIAHLRDPGGNLLEVQSY
ncbi:hypothetical protein [Actinomadura mexicana]|uniref:VOC domain-containing protein n=1 Tax=Actinomadura mexicana TaxID=134959 RepID=A0A239FBA0_9ACTN|nr:hypothetical protein [Actinomadura mexicana]SNS54169.1 hypothetical protein SAMN06265355_12033 [Actinomadura mexicana]